MGYHHRRFEPPRYQLITQLISDIGGTIDPDHPTGFYYDWYTQVPLSVTEPPLGYRIKWINTDDDESTGATNVVTMDSDKVVVAEFEQYWYTLTVQVTGPGTVSTDPNGINDNYPPGSVVYLTAEPVDGYRVRVWTGADIDPLWGTGTAKVTMDGNRTVIVEFEPDISDNLLVPDEYATIEEAVEAASSGDAIILKRRDAAYTISNPDGIDFMGKNITIMSEKPHEPNCVAATVIDCQGSRYVSKRAFHFHMGEGRNSKIWGITIKNGYIAGKVLGEVPGNGALPGYLIDPEADPNAADAVFSANNGANARGRGYGGAILCENGSSPTIENCVITRCSVTGGQGGDGANGYYVFAGMEPPDGQWGGHAGNGSGYGYGGAVACRDESNPAIINCILTDNAARGGCGGIGGDGSQKENPDEGNESWGGNGGGASGAGFGGAIYCDGTSIPAVVDCTFRDNIATSGLPGQGGLPGPGSALDPPAGNGANGSTTTFGDTAGGAAYYGLNCDPNFISCTFVKNEAYEVHLIYQSGFGLAGGYGYVETPIYTRGGALYSESFNVVTLDNCTFTEHLGGAVYCDGNSEVDIDNCVFRNNQSRSQISVSPADYGTSLYPSYYDYYYDAATAPAGALDAGSNCEVNIDGCEFMGNYSHGDGGAIHSRSNAVVKNCSFGGNIAQANGGAVEAHDLDASMPLTVDFEACSFGGNEAMLGGAVFFRDFDAAFADCYFAGNRAQSGGGLFLVDGVIALAGGYIIDNHATGVVSASQATDEEAGRGGGVVCVTTIATIENCVISGNIAEGTYSYGGGVGFYGGSDIITHEVRNCLITGNRAGVAGGGISCRIFTMPEIANCTFEGNSAGSYGSGVFSDWRSQPQISDSIFAGCDSRAIYEEKIGDDAFVRYCLFHNNPNGDFYDADTGQGYNGADAINSVAGNHDNIEGDPLFVIGPIGDHYLDQSSSAAVDAGSDLAVNLGMDDYTTDPDPNNPDKGTVDIGYHYGDTTNVPQYQLKVVIPNGHGTVEAVYKDQTYYGTPAEPLIISATHGAKITITAYPDEGYRMASWSGGTVNDNSKELTNVVVMTFNKRIEVRFEQPRTLWVGTILEDERHFTSIQHAIDAAVDGDVVVILPGEYTPPTWGYGPYNGIHLYNKDIVLTTAQPADPDGVIINGYHFHLYDVGPDAIIEGITITRGRMNLYRSSPAIRNCKFMDSNWKGMTVITPDGCAQDGGYGVSVLGGAIAMYQNSSPAVSNCVFENCSVEGGDGNQANDGCEEHPAGGDGGWPGRAYGGAVYCAYSSSPTFLDCLFANCSASGGTGGNGGNGNENPDGYGGRGGGWTWPSFIEDNPFYWWWWDGWTYGDKYSVWLAYGYNNYDWETWGEWFDTSQWGSWEQWYAAYLASSSVYGQMTPYDSYEDYWEFSGYGGAGILRVRQFAEVLRLHIREQPKQRRPQRYRRPRSVPTGMVPRLPQQKHTNRK